MSSTEELSLFSYEILGLVGRDGAGPLHPLLHAMTEPDSLRRTPSAEVALAQLRRLGVPAGVPPGVPLVPDRLGPPPPRWRRPRVGGRF
jgi:hypothetical protein